MGKRFGNIGIQFLHGNRFDGAVANDFLQSASAGERRPAGQTKVQRATQGIDIGASIHLGRILGLLRRDIVHGPDHVSLAADDGTIGRQFTLNQSQAQVENLGVVVGSDEDVGGFQVAMNQAAQMGMVQAVGDFGEEASGPR